MLFFVDGCRTFLLLDLSEVSLPLILIAFDARSLVSQSDFFSGAAAFLLLPLNPSVLAHEMRYYLTASGVGGHLRREGYNLLEASLQEPSP